MPPLHALAFVMAATATAFALAARQAWLNSGIGSDTPVHAFLISALRKSRLRLFTRIPGLLNEVHCAALPLYLHWIFALLPNAAVAPASRLLNPVVNAMHVLLVATIALFAFRAGRGGLEIVVATAWLYALTPQFYHALSARNFGLSARGLGLIQLTAFLFGALLAESTGSPWAWALLGIAAYLVWAFSTFGAQSMVILSLFMVCLGHWLPACGALLGLGMFIAVHPRYSFSYLKHTLAFIHTYAVDLAPVYTLAKRFSLWRDLVWDIWLRVARDPAAGIRYAYENSLLIAVMLNPLLIVAAGARIFLAEPDNAAIAFAADVALCGVAATLVTSFRPTRFLGEPERYAEATAPWGAICGTAYLTAQFGAKGVLLAAALFLVLDMLQLGASRIFQRHMAKKTLGLESVHAAITRAIPTRIRLSGNNEQFTKRLLTSDWEFVYCMAVERNYCGISLSEAFTEYPFLRRAALERIVEQYRINACVLDRNQYDTLFDEPPNSLRASRIIYESEELRVLFLDWSANFDTPAA